MRFAVDVAVVGSGFGGSLMALVLRQLGLKPVLVDQGTHPRFAIGESTTPIANLVLKDLAAAYDLPRLTPLAKFGSWQRAYPTLPCGLKRWFSYFRHRPGETYSPDPERASELLVAASSSDEQSDTHWLRSSFDQFLVGEVAEAGITYLDRTRLAVASQHPRWKLIGERGDEPIEIEARFVIDATGGPHFLLKHLAIPDRAAELLTHSRGLFAHFEGLRKWQKIYEECGGDPGEHPFACDAAAVHQVIDQGWMWQLRFQNGVTSAGFALATPLDPAVSIDQEWRVLLDQYPSLARQFASARCVAPEGGLVRSPRMQRLAAQMAGDNWALLPHTAGFIDPLHSSGIAHTLCGIERLARIIGRHWENGSLAEELQRYGTTVEQELRLVDAVVHGCYLAAQDFRFYTTFALLYFILATTYERRRLAGELPAEAAFLYADDPQLRNLVATARQLLLAGLQSAQTDAAERFQEQFAALTAPYNHAGLCDRAAKNLYRHTALPEEQATCPPTRQEPAV